MSAVVFDVDGTISNGKLPGEGLRARPGIRLVFDILHALGIETHVWSTNGALYAKTIATELGLEAEAHNKNLSDVDPGVLYIDNDARTVTQIKIGTLADALLVKSWWGIPRDAPSSRVAELTEQMRVLYAMNAGDEHQPRFVDNRCERCGLPVDECWAICTRLTLEVFDEALAKIEEAMNG